MNYSLLVDAADEILTAMHAGRVTPDEAVETWKRERERIAACPYSKPDRCSSVRCSCRERVEALRYRASSVAGTDTA